MLKAPIPKNEKQRLASLYAFKLLDTKQEERFDRITLIATKIFHVPISTLTLIDANREWFKSCQGLKKREGDRAISFCGHAVLNGNLFIIEDTRKDPRFSDNPMVVGKPFIRFYAGVPIKSADGARIGVFCIKDTKPRSLSENEKEILTGLAKWAELEINSRNLRLILDEVEKGKSKNEAILQSIGDGAIAIDQTGNILFANDNALRMLKLKRKEAIGSNYKDLWQVVNEKGDILEFDKRPIQRAIKFRRKVITDPKHICYYVRLDKTQIPVSITVAPIKYDKKIIGVIDVFRDISKEQAIDRAKSEFVSLSSHQLRTPLSVISWYTEMLLSSDLGDLNSNQRTYLMEVYNGSKRMTELLNTLLEISRLEMGTFMPVYELVDLKGIIHDVLKILDLEIKEKKIKLKTNFGKNIPVVFFDKRLLSMILQNLFSNAIKYSPVGEEVLFRVYPNQKKITFQISDNGYGIPKKQQDKIFTRFFRADNVILKDTEGAGLGLYLVKMVVELMKGKIWFTSEENKGTDFFVSLPLIKKSKN